MGEDVWKFRVLDVLVSCHVVSSRNGYDGVTQINMSYRVH